MTSTATTTVARRNLTEKRREEIAEAAGRIAEADGLAKLTAKRVAESVGVYPGLVNHYFRSADDLSAALFAAERRSGPAAAAQAHVLYAAHR
jgi:AcrR family transcriptional regulator